MTPGRLAEHAASRYADLHPVFPWNTDDEGLRFIDDWAAGLDRGLTLEEAWAGALMCMYLRRSQSATESAIKRLEGTH